MLDVIATPPETLIRARKRALAAGLHHVYVGNIHDLENGSTYCRSCGQVLIERDWYELGRYNLGERGCCKFCEARLPGRFEAKPGTGPQSDQGCPGGRAAEAQALWVTSASRLNVQFFTNGGVNPNNVFPPSWLACGPGQNHVRPCATNGGHRTQIRRGHATKVQ
jgi:hypothetical protein